jgi:hypothetical protein
MHSCELLLQCVHLFIRNCHRTCFSIPTALAIYRLQQKKNPLNKLYSTTFLSRPLFLLRSPRQPLLLLHVPLLLSFPHPRFFVFVFVFLFYLLFLDRKRLFIRVPALGVSVFSSVTMLGDVPGPRASISFVASTARFFHLSFYIPFLLIRLQIFHDPATCTVPQVIPFVGARKILSRSWT